MTTIAWDGKTLAADTQLTANGMRYSTTKAHRLADGSLFASCGDHGLNTAVRRWLEDQSQPKPVVGKDDGFSGLLIKADGSLFRMDTSMNLCPVQSAFFADGSGRDYAMAAMHLGKTAKEAVELASLFCVFTGGSITELTLGA